MVNMQRPPPCRILSHPSPESGSPQVRPHGERAEDKFRVRVAANREYAGGL